MAIPPIGVFFLYFALSTPNSFFCTIDSRNSSCTVQEPQPVCAVYSGEDCYSPTGLCEKTIDSGCLACNDPSIISYVPGECSESKAPQLCTDYDRDLSCSVVEDTACGYAFSFRFGRQKVYSQQWKNGCNACSPIHTTFHIPGECQDSDSFGICQQQHRKSTVCSPKQPSCAYYTGGDCTSKVCRKTVKTSCGICEDDSSVLFHIDGTCEDPKPWLFTRQASKTVEEESSNEKEENVPGPVIEQDGQIIYQEIHSADFDDSKYLPKPLLVVPIETIEPEEPQIKIREEPECEVPDQPDIPLLEEVIQPDGSVKFELVKNPQKDIVENKVNTVESQTITIDSRLLANDKVN